MRRTPLHPPSGQAGIALLEVLVSVLLFSLGILGLIGLQARAINFSVDAEDRNRAALLANEVATLMWIKKSIIVSTDELDAWKARVADPAAGGLPNGEGDVVVTGNAADVTITWKPPARKTDESGSTLTTRVVLP
ncbi:MAG: fimbrial assembly protein [Comamonadaceae bacterium]|nr:MAG: fimbrial assembly protein [Comamonadaceae bacterium]